MSSGDLSTILQSLQMTIAYIYTHFLHPAIQPSPSIRGRRKRCNAIFCPISNQHPTPKPKCDAFFHRHPSSPPKCANPTPLHRPPGRKSSNHPPLQNPSNLNEIKKSAFRPPRSIAQNHRPTGAMPAQMHHSLHHPNHRPF